MDLIAQMQARGLIHQTTGDDSLREHLREPRTLYCGFDPTADSLHIGHLVPLLALQRFQRAGHRPVALVGGATGMIGDPSGRSSERNLNTNDTVQAWSDKVRLQVSQFVDFDCPGNPAVVVNNYDWTKDLSMLDFLRDIGKHFSVNTMIQRDSVRLRLERAEQGISFTEFSYMLLQSYDFSVLARDYQCSLQIGGSDQWGNIVGGVDLARRLHGAQCHGLTLPLITKADGSKFGKTGTGTVWLSAEKTSPYAFYQFWINSADADVYRFLRIYSNLSLDQIDTLEADDAQSAGKPEAQRILAENMTQLVHGEAGLLAAQRISAALFCGELGQLTANDYAQLALDGLPTQCVDDGCGIVDALLSTGLADSKRRAREFLSNGAVRIGEQSATQDSTLTRENACFGRYHLLRRGKKEFRLIDHGQ